MRSRTGQKRFPCPTRRAEDFGREFARKFGKLELVIGAFAARIYFRFQSGVGGGDPRYGLACDRRRIFSSSRGSAKQKEDDDRSRKNDLEHSRRIPEYSQLSRFS